MIRDDHEENRLWFKWWKLLKNLVQTDRVSGRLEGVTRLAGRGSRGSLWGQSFLGN